MKNNKFLQVLLASRRAKQLINGDHKRVDNKSENPLTVAMDEIRQKKIELNDILHMPLFFDREPEPEAARPTSAEAQLVEFLTGGSEPAAAAAEEEEEPEEAEKDEDKKEDEEA